jgi:hypothetical protein
MPWGGRGRSKLFKIMDDFYDFIPFDYEEEDDSDASSEH